MSYLTRNNANINTQIKLIFIHSVASVKRDVGEILGVDIYDQDPVRAGFNLEPIEIIPPADVYHPAEGIYEYLMSEVSKGNQYYFDVVRYKVKGSEEVKKGIGQLWAKGELVSAKMPKDKIDMLRVYLHDDNPDEDYHFAPPTAPAVQFDVKSKTRYVWNDYQLSLALELGASIINSTFPVTGWGLSEICQHSLAHWLHASAIEAVRMKVPLWISEEFDYSVGSLSLAIGKADKYQSYIDSMWTAFMDTETGFPKTKRSLTIRSKAILNFSNNYLMGRGSGALTMGRGFSSRTNLGTLFV